MRKPILYTEDDQEIDGYEAVPVDDYVLHYDPTRASIDDVVNLHNDVRYGDTDRFDRFWDAVEVIAKKSTGS